MNFPLLDRLGIPSRIQTIFADCIKTDRQGNLIFEYGLNMQEHFGINFHLVPSGTDFWSAGCTVKKQIREIFICASAMEAIAFLRFNEHKYPDLDKLMFVSFGNSLCPEHFNLLQEEFASPKFNLVYPNHANGRLIDLKIALAVNRQPVKINIDGELIRIFFRYQEYCFELEAFSLNAFFRASGYWPENVRTFKPKKHLTWLSQLLSAL